MNTETPTPWTLKDQPPVQLLALAIIWLVVALLSGVALQALVQSWGWENLSALLQEVDPETVDGTTIDRLRWVQLLAHLSNYTLVALIFAAWAYGRRAPRVLKLDRPPQAYPLLLSLGLTVALFPIIGWVYYWNTTLLPEAWIAQDKLALQRLFLTMDQPADFWLNLSLLGGAAAIGEELIFRGVIQPATTKWSGSPHVGSWVTGALFSLIHFQWEGFLPRMLMGVFFCYVFWYTQNLWVPLLLHSFFNSIQVVLPYLYPDAIESTTTPQPVSWISLTLGVCCFIGLWILFENYKKIKEIKLKV